MSSVLTFLGLAITDAMNPFTVASVAMLPALDRAVARGLIFAITTFVIYLIFAVLLAEGWTAGIVSVLPMVPAWVDHAPLSRWVTKYSPLIAGTARRGAEPSVDQEADPADARLQVLRIRLCHA